MSRPDYRTKKISDLENVNERLRDQALAMAVWLIECREPRGAFAAARAVVGPPVKKKAAA